MFPAQLGYSLAGKALDNNLWQLNIVNLRDYGIGKHKNVDDTPAGGGAGMVIRADVLGNAIDANYTNGDLIYMSPRGKKFTQNTAQKWVSKQDISIICGRFEGIDQRVIDYYNITEVSVGDFILSGGEPAAIICMDACIRLLDGVIGNPETHKEESFVDNKLEYPHYTKPQEWNGLKIPEVLLQGNHKKIAEFRDKSSKDISE